MYVAGLAVPLVGVNAFATAAPLIDKMVVVSEEFIALAILRLVEMEKAVVEGAGATGIAAVLAGLLPELEGKKYVFREAIHANHLLIASFNLYA